MMRWIIPLTLALLAVVLPRAVEAAPEDGGVDAAFDATADAPFDARLNDAAPAAADAMSATRADGGAEKVWASCMENVPAGASRPTMEEAFPDRGYSGHALRLHVVLRHGKGETVLPNGFRVQHDSDAARALRVAGFAIPSPDGGSAPSIARRDDDQGAVTEVDIPFVALPPEAGRHHLTLPPVPLAVSRASGELITVCTQPHDVTIDDPIANEPDPAPKNNPDPRRQREQWTLARDLTYGALIGGAVAALLAWLVVRWLRRPRPAPPPPPPRPPWEVALEELRALRAALPVDAAQAADHVDHVSDAIRRYLGALYGFDGIESTTDEVLASLAMLQPPLPQFDGIRSMLVDCDLVKFARWIPTSSDCSRLLDEAERIVMETMPKPGPAQPVAGAAKPPPEATP